MNYLPEQHSKQKLSRHWGKECKSIETKAKDEFDGWLKLDG